MKIKPIEEKYLLQVEKLHIQTFKEIGQTKQDFQQLIKREFPCLVAVNEKDKVIGYAIYIVREKMLYFSWMGVIPANQKQGVGEKLILAVIKNAKKNKVCEIELHSRNRFKGALRLYLKHGFNIEGTYLGSDGEMMIVMRKKDLSPF